MDKTYFQLIFRRKETMVIIITGASHTGKTKLAGELVRRTGYFCVSLDHLKMGLIRSSNTSLTVYDD